MKKDLFFIAVPGANSSGFNPKYFGYFAQICFVMYGETIYKKLTKRLNTCSKPQSHEDIPTLPY
jgi:hypothetical protein